MKYKKVYKVLNERHLRDSGFQYYDHSGWRSPHQSYMTLQRPLWIIAEDPVAGRRIWITQERAKLSITVGPMDEHGHNYGHARMIFCRNQTELVSELKRLFADAAATA